MNFKRLLMMAGATQHLRQYKQKAEASITAIVIQAAMGAAAAMFVVIALAFIAVSVYLKLSQTMVPWVAALWVAGIYVVIGAILWFIGARMARNAKLKVISEAPPSPLAPFGIAAGFDQSTVAKGRELGAKLQDTMSRHPGATVGAGLAAGLILGILPMIRRFAVGPEKYYPVPADQEYWEEYYRRHPERLRRRPDEA